MNRYSAVVSNLAIASLGGLNTSIVGIPNGGHLIAFNWHSNSLEFKKKAL
jgi:hypothetical protein